MNMNQQTLILMSIRLIRAFLITMPVIVLYWQQHGLSMQDIFVLQVIFSIAIVVFEVPSGYFADRYGRANSIRLGCVLSTLGFFMYWYWPSFLGFAVAEIILALGTGFMSGSQEALLFESLKNNERKNNTAWQGRLMMVGNISEAIAAVSAGIVAAKFGIVAVIAAQSVIFSISIPLSLALQETRRLQAQKTPSLLKILRGSIHENKRLQALNLYAGAMSAGTLMIVWLVQPHWQALGVSILYFGYLWAGLNLTVAVGSWLAPILEKCVSFRKLFLWLAIILFLSFCVMALGSKMLWILAVTPIFWLIRGITRPIFTDYVQKEASEEERATVLSINQLSARLLFSIFSPWLGWLVDVYDFKTAFIASGLIFGSIALIGVLLLYRSYRT